MNRLPQFQLHQPGTIDDAVGVLARWEGSASVLMGGTELLPLMKLGLTSVDHLVDCRGLTDHLRIEDRYLVIGSGVTHRQLEKAPMVSSALPVLAELERNLATVRVRNVGTIGGNICFAEPRSDPATLFVALGATVAVVSQGSRRSVPLEEFYVGPFSTVLDGIELLTEVRVPLPAISDRVGFQRIAIGERPAANIAFKVGTDGVRIAIGAVGLHVTRAHGAEEILAGAGANAIHRAAQAAAAEVPTVSDVDGSDEYKRHLVEVLLCRSLTAVYERDSNV